MKIQNKATSVLERTSAYLKSGLLVNKPSWFDVVASHPPAKDLTKVPKTLRNGSYQDKAIQKLQEKTRLSSKDLKNQNSKAHKVPKLRFLEDELRDLFYKRHPWEFSRPKVLIENHGNDNQHCDWSHMVQMNKPLDGESVVQRTMWLVQNSGKDLFESYDHARFEFYKLRMEEELQSVVSKEESSMYGAVYATSNLQRGVELEQVFVDEWAKLASEKTKIKRANISSRMSGPEGGSKSIFEENLEVEVDEE